VGEIWIALLATEAGFVCDKASSVVAVLRLGMKDTVCITAYVPSCSSVLDIGTK
jgi:hypothetical protein